MSISLKEILGKYKFEDLPKEHQDNCMILLERINKIRQAYGKPMQVSSGYRSMEDHLRIYKNKGITDPNKIPMQSKHLSAAAIDIADPNQELQKWCLNNISLLENVELWCEDFSATSKPSAWVHMQIFPPKSNKRFFIP